MHCLGKDWFSDLMESPAPVHIDRNSLSRVLMHYRMGDRMAADTYIRETLKMVPDQVQTKYCLAALALEAGDLDATGQLLDEVGAESVSAEVAYLKGRLAEAQGDMAKAGGHLDQALRMKPDYVGALYAMGRVVQRSGHPAEAAEYHRKALRLHPLFAAAAHHLGKVLFSMGRLDDALAAFHQAVKGDPGLTVGYMDAASTLREMGEAEKARNTIEAALERDDDPLLRIQLSLMLPIIFSTDGDIDDVRVRTEKELDGIAARHIRSTDPFAFPGNTGFYLAYHGRNNRILQSQLAKAYCTAAPDLVWTAAQAVRPHRGNHRIRVSIVSPHLHRHTIGYLNAGIVKHLSRSAFEVTVGRFQGETRDDMAAAIDRSADRVVHLAPEIPESRRQLADLNLDVIYYPDIGMHPITYFLAYSRLAPVQCTSWGHPDTTGIPNLDYYVSNRLAEPVGAQAHYTEKLVCLNRFPMYVHKPSPAPVRRRQDFGLPSDRR
ncbi:MAG: tetratricopeptide repeat protein, partial [Desulfobacteraceae bacterium]